MDAAVKVTAVEVGSVSWWRLLGSGDQHDGNDDCHSEMRGPGPQDSVGS
jgi:hypothetical protein